MKQIFCRLRDKFFCILKYIFDLCNKIIPIVFFLMLVCIWAKELIKNVLITVGVNDEKIIEISKCLHLSIKASLIVITIYLIMYILYFFINKIYIWIYRRKQQKRYNKMLESEKIDQNIKELYKNIYSYFSSKNSNIPIFISGEWGSGKTYTVNNFISQYYKYSKQKIYNISCFGVTTKEAFLQTIREECENKDNGFSYQVIKLIGEFPIIGAFLKNILEKKYDINNINGNSIFVFDNFERIEWAKYNNGYGEDTNNNYENVISKYDIVSGIIDELIEKYKMKVIIIGDESRMVPGYVHNTFICKFGCKKYTITPKGKVFEDIWKEIISKEIDAPKYSDKLNSIFDEVSLQTQIIWSISGNKNIRILHKITYNYIQYILFLYEKEYQFKEEINEEISIYFTNLIINLFHNQGLDIKLYESIGLYYGKKAIRFKDTKFASLDTINAMWCSDRTMDYLFMNLEQNYENLFMRHKNIVDSFSGNYLSKRNCDKSDLNLKRVDFESVAYLLVFAKETCLENIYKWFDKKIIDFSNPDEVVNIIDIYKLDEIFIKNNILMYDFFEKNNKGEESIFIKDSERFCRKSERFKRMLEKYKQINDKN